MDEISKTTSDDAQDTCEQEPVTTVVPSLAVVEGLIYETAPLRRTYEQIRLPVLLRTLGCWFAGASGEGKSTAVEYCCNLLRTEFPRMPVYSLNVHMLPATALRSVPIRILEAVAHGDTTGDPTRIRVRIAQYMAERAMRSPLRQVVLVFDESQELRPQDLFLLKDMANDLGRLGVGLVTILLGESPRTESLRDRIAVGQNEGLVQRFFGKELQLGTYDSREDWISLLGQMDKQSFSELGGRTVPETFLRDRRDVPYRLQSEARRLWKALRARRKGKSRPSVREIFNAMRWWILHAGALLHANDALPETLWEDALVYAACAET